MEYTIDQLKKDVSDAFAPVTIVDGEKTYHIRSLLLMSEDRRDRALEALDRISNQDEDLSTAEALKVTERAMDDFLSVAVEDGLGTHLARLLGSLAAKRKVIQDWAEISNAGKAEPSTD